MPVHSTTCRSGMYSHPETRRPPAVTHEVTHEWSLSVPTFAAFDGGVSAPDGAVCPLRPASTSSRTAREFATKTLCSWGLDALVDDAVVIISELVTNAIRHGLPPYAAAAGEMPIKLTLVRQGRFVVCIVSDPSDQSPEVRAADDVCENGRGLHVIEALSRVWGWTPLPGAGKAVWAALTVC
jgi:anti-sigma regulatory factor (Ser/Thr protein kinase)